YTSVLILHSVSLIYTHLDSTLISYTLLPSLLFFFNDTSTTEIYTLSLHDALPILISTALDNIPTPPSSRLLGWHVLDARPKDGWIRIGFDGKRDFCNPAGFVQGGILSAMLDDTMGPAVLTMTSGKLYTAAINMTV